MSRINIRPLRFVKSLIGLGIGSIAAAATFLVLSGIPAGFRSIDMTFVANAIVPGSIIIFVFALPCGFAAHALLYALKRRWLGVYCLAAVIEAALYGIIGSLGHMTQSAIEMILFAMPAAAVCAAAAWLIRRPDQDEAGVLSQQ